MGVQKTIHQRNKSSPALSTMANAGGLKAAAKRTAFGEISNTANILRPSRDDSVLGSKGFCGGTEKIGPLQQEKKATALSKPAQRPLSIAGLKGLLNNVTQNTAPPPVKLPLADVQQPAPPKDHNANIRKVLSKRSTAIFKDRGTTIDERGSETIKTLPSTAPLVTIPSDLLPQSRHQPPVEEVAPQLRKAESNAIVRPEVKHDVTDPLALPKSSDEPDIARSDGVYIDENGRIQVYQFSDEVEAPQKPYQPLDNSVALPQVPRNESSTKAIKQLEEHVPRTQTLPAQKHELSAISEPEEYWDDEEDDYNYEEEGYVTARSFRSRGENTTGGATTVLIPKISLKAKKELAAAKALMEAAKAANEIDDETWDTTMVAEYGDEIFQYMRELEDKMLPKAHYMDDQAEIQWSMRSVLMDWLVQVHQRFGLLPETLFLTCNYIDRFLSRKIVSLGKLQLVGATAIFIAAKYEEINCPSVQEIVYMVDNGYTVDEILKAERFMLSMLGFELGWPGPMSFLRRISKADDYDLETRTLAKYFLELTIMDERFVGSPPSFLAAGAHCLSRMMLKKGHWVSPAAHSLGDPD